MLVFVDYEHADRYAAGGNLELQAARAWLTYRLEDLAGMPCMLVRWNRVNESLLDRLGARALFISGNSAAPEAYDAGEVAPLNGLITSGRLPIFGFCGGLQCAAQAFGAELTPLDANLVAAADPDLVTRWPNGLHAEVGYRPIDIVDRHDALFSGLGDRPVFRHAHALQVPCLPERWTDGWPDEWRVLASTTVTPVQLVVDEERRFVGTQFHPEYWTDEHPDGRTLIANFLRWADVVR